MLAADQAAAVAGNIAFIDRGTCGFTIKVKNAQDAGAVAAIVASTATGAFGTMGGTDPTITIPSVIVPFAEGNLLRDNLTGLNVTLFSGADTMASFSSRGPRLSASPIQLKPDVAAPGFAITSAQTGVTCTAGNCIVPNAGGFLAGSQPLVLNGTSMAAPHVAGIMALLRQRHPDWTVEELKALVMNTSLHDVTSFPGGNGDRFGPGRLGAGRVDTNLAARSDVVAFNTDDDGLVSLAFDGRVFGNVTRTRKVRVVNHGTTPQHYDLAIDTVVDAPGVSYLVGLNSVTVPAGSSVEVDVTMTADASQMDHARDATVATTQAAPVPLAGVLGALSRHWLTEEAGYLTFNQSGATQLRVPIHAVAMPHSNMSAGPTITTGGATTGSTTIPLSGTELCTGTLTAGPTCEGTFPTDIASLVSPFELQVVSPADPVSAPPFADIQYVGVAHIAATNQYLFGVSTWAPWGSPSQVAFNIYIDSNNDGTWDSILFNSNPGTMAANLFGSTPASPQDTFIAGRLSIPASTVSISSANNLVNLLPAAAIESRVFDNQVLVLAAPAPQLNITGAFRYKVMTCPGSAPLCQQLNGFHFDEAAGPYSWNASAQGLDFNGARLLQDLNGGSIPLTWNLANMTANGSLGALLLHHHNQPGSRAEVVLLEGAAQTDLGITFSASPTAPAVGQTTTLTATVTNHGSTAATGIQVLLDLPPALTFVSAGGGGTFHDGDGTWSIPSVPAAGSVSLEAIYTAEAAGSLAASATITASTPLDPNPENNHAVLGLNPPSSADVQVTASASGAPVAPGGSASYALEVRNNGNETAYNVVVSTTFVAGVGTIAGGTPSHGVFTAGTGQWRIASLGRGAAATVTLAATATSGPLLTLSANAASLVTDPAPTNNIATASVAVTPRPTTLTLTLDPATVHVGSGSVATVTVLDAAAGSTPPAGTVGFVSTDNSDGLSALSCTLAPVPATTDRSSCQVIVTPSTVGPRTVTASYVANGIHGTSISTATLTATLRPTTLTLTLDPATVHAGSGSVATVTVLDAAAGASHPVGTVGFLSTGSSDTLSAPSCTLAPVVATTDRSSCQVTVTPGAAGPRTVTASYVANGIHDTSTATATLTATLRPTTLTLTLDPATVHVGSGSIATAIVIDGAAGASNPAGTVGFLSTGGGDTLSAPSCTLAPVPATTDRSSCQVTVTPGAAGPRTVAASYVGNGVHAASTAPATLTATLRPTTLTLTLDPATVQTGIGSIATAIVIDGSASGSHPAGTVGFVSTDSSDGLSAPSCTLAPVPATTDRSSCQVTVTPGTAAPRTVTASYVGNGVHAASTAPATLTATLRPTTLTLTLDPAIVQVGSGSVATAIVIDGAAGASNPAGTVGFLSTDDGDTLSAPACTLAPVPATTDRSSCQVTVTPGAGAPRTVTASYAGNGIHAASTASATLIATSRQLTYVLSEGATGAFLDTSILIANPNALPAPIDVAFIKDDGTTVTRNMTLLPTSRTTIHVPDIRGLESANFSTQVTTSGTLPLVIERTTTWDATGYGAHTEKASFGPASTWYFAEGSQGFFHTYFLLGNPQPVANAAHVTYLLDDGTTVQRTYPMLPTSRLTLDASVTPELANRSFGATITFDQPGMAERAMYFDTPTQLFGGGSASAGVTVPSTTWHLAEGATGTFFNTFLLIANPGTIPTTATVTYLLDSGGTVTRTHPLAAHQRLTLNVALEDPLLANGSFAMVVDSLEPIIVERSLFWPVGAWHESHSSAALPAPQLNWGLAEGQVGGPTRAQTYILVGNGGSNAADLTVTFLRTNGTTVVKSFTVAPNSRLNIAVTGAESAVPELVDEAFATIIQSTQPIVVERSVYLDVGGTTWAAGTSATASPLP